MAEAEGDNKEKVIAPVPEHVFVEKVMALVKEKVKMEENKDETDVKKIEAMIMKSNMAEADIKDIVPKALEIEARKAKLEDDDFKVMFGKMKKAAGSTAEAQLVQVDDFMKAINKEARGVMFDGKKASLLFDKIPKVKAPESSDSEEVENEMFDFFDNIA